MSFDVDGLLQFLGEAGIEPDGTTRRSVTFRCPRCEKARKLSMIRENGYWSCWHCAALGVKGWPEDLLVLLLQVDWTQAKEMLGQNITPTDTFFLPPPWTELEVEEDVLPIMAWPAHAFRLDHPQARRGVAYLEGRGLPRDLLMEYDVRYSQEWRRVMFPMVVEGFLTGWQGRSVVDAPTDPVLRRRYLKAKNSDDLPRGRAFMFEGRLRGVGHAVITEGPVDALKAHVVGGNVAALGKVVTDGQVATLVRYGVRTAYLALDPDAMEENKLMVRRLRDHGIATRWVEIPEPYEDLGAMPLGEAARTILDAPEITLQDFIFRLADSRWTKTTT